MVTFYNILIVSQYYYPDVTAAAFRIKEMADILSSKGHKITVITTRPHKGIIQPYGEIDDGNVEVIRLPIILYYGKGKWDYIIHYGSFVLVALFYFIINFGRRYDFVLATSPPLPVGLAGFLMSKLRGSKLVLDIRDIWPESAVVAGQLNKKSRLYKLAKKMEHWLYWKADLITCVSKPMAEYIKGILKGGKVAVIYNGVPQKYLQQDYCNNDCKIDFINRRKISLTYLGNMGYVQNLQVALETAKQIKSEMPEIYFYLIGDGVERRKLEKFIEDNMLDNVAIMGPVTKEQAMWLMQCSSALFFQLKDDVVMEKTVPSKVFDYMTAGKPILFGIKGEGKEILEQVKGNIFYQPDCVESFIEAVRILKKNYETLSESAIRNRAILQQQYIREKLVERLDKYLREMMQSF